MISHGVEISIAGGGADEKDDRLHQLEGGICKRALSIQTLELRGKEFDRAMESLRREW